MKEYNLLEIDNLSIPSGGSIDRRLGKLMIGVVVCMMSEYAIGHLGYDSSDDKIYPFIRQFFKGEYHQGELLKKLMSEPEIAGFFVGIPDIKSDKFGDPEWKNYFENIFVSSGQENHYRLGQRTFKSPRYFLNLRPDGDGVKAQKYLWEAEYNTAFFVDCDNDSISQRIDEPFTFEYPERRYSVEKVPVIDEEVFFSAEGMKSIDKWQRAAITSSTEKNLVILAGAGSGKTRTLVSRLAYLHLVKGIPLSKIILLTFTNSAAAEMRQRAENQIKEFYLLNGKTELPTVYAKTIDSMLRQLLMDYYVEIGFMEKPDFDIKDDVNNETDREFLRSFVKGIICENQLEATFSDFVGKDDKLYILIKNLRDYANGLVVNIVGIDGLWELILNKQKELNVVYSFMSANLLVKRALEREDSLLRKAIKNRYSCMLIDEFQDISRIQNDTLKLFYNSDIHFTFVGDDDQSIYAWRGADVSIIRDIVNSANTDTRYLLINYRNNPNIVKAGNCILRRIEDRSKTGEITPYKKTGVKIRVAENDEKFENLADEVERLIHSGCKPQEISVLTRVGNEREAVIKALKLMKIPVSWAARKPRIDNYYRLLRDLICIRSDYQVYHSYSDILKQIKSNEYSQDEVCKIVSGKIPCKGKIKAVQDIALYIFKAEVTQLSDVVERYMEKVGDVFSDFPCGRLQTTSEIVEHFFYYCKDKEVPWPIGGEQLSALFGSFESEGKSKGSKNERMTEGVNVVTIHGAKGLEYNVVMIAGLSQGSYPDIGKIDRQYEAKLRELEALRGARKDYYSIKSDMKEAEIRLLADEFDKPEFSDEIKKTMALFADFVRRNMRGLKNLVKDSLEDYVYYYRNSIVEIDHIYSFERNTLLGNIEELKKCIDIQQRRIANDEHSESEENNIAKLEGELAQKYIENNTLMELQKTFFNNTSKIRDFFMKAHLVLELIENMTKADEIEVIREKLEKERKIKIDEERRTFYVAVTRARDFLYLFTKRGDVPSEFIADIDDELKVKYNVMTKNQWKEFERLTKKLKGELEKDNIDDEKADVAVDHIINDRAFINHVRARLETYMKDNPEYSTLSGEAKKYFEQGMSLLFVGELTGTDFRAEFAHNMQRVAECYLDDVAGGIAMPFMTDDPSVIEQITRKLRTDAQGVKTQLPSRRYIEELLLSDSGISRMDNLKKAGIEHYIVRSHQFDVGENVLSTWNIQVLYGNPRSFLTAVLDLSNIRNTLIHEGTDDENNKWHEDVVTQILKNLRMIIESG